MLAMDTHYASCGDASIAYQVIGQGDVDIVFVPCWLSHLDRIWREPRFAAFVESMSAFGRVILFDHRGTGLSDPAPTDVKPTLEARMDDLLAVLDAAESKQAILVGVDVGGRVSALFAATYPEHVAGLALFGASARGTWAPDYPFAPTESEHAARIAQVEREWGGPIWVDTYAASLAHDPAFRRWWAGCLRSAGGPSAAAAMLRMNMESDIREALPSISAPTLVLHRTGDRAVDIAEGRYLADHIPGARFVELEGVDHLAFVGDQDAIISEMSLFITGTRPGPRTERVLATVAVINLGGAAEVGVRLGAPRWAEVRTEFRTLLKETLQRYHGRAAVTSIDSIAATFDGPARAVRFAEEVVEGTRRLGLRARAGVHTGDVHLTGDKVGGMATHLATRVTALAKPGEVLVSATVMGIVAGSGLRFVEAEGRDRSSLPDGWRLYRLNAGELPETHTGVHGRTSADVVTLPSANLTPREREVAALLARGLSNREIGDELVISASTAERHVANILTKLGFRSRAQIAAWSASQSTHPLAQPPSVAPTTGYGQPLSAAAD